MIKISIVFGTRPEAIKLARVIAGFKNTPGIKLDVCFTGQHKEMVLPLLDFFEIKIDHSLRIMQVDQTLAGLTSRSLSAVDDYLEKVKPDIVFVQGDTTTAMCAAIASFYRKIKIAHVEAGLRTYNMMSPFPEEFNRQAISKITDLHFAPTESARQNLLQEKVDEKKIIVTGNTVIDTLLFTHDKIKTVSPGNFKEYPWSSDRNKNILITCHRRENFGDGFENICEAIKELANKYLDINFIFPVHLNPNVQEPVLRILRGHVNVFLIQPLNYLEFTALMATCYLILTDSGGVQEEAPSLGKPVLIMRDNTEREEAVKAGAAKLVGSNKDSIVQNVVKLVEDKNIYRSMSGIQNPFGDGKAVERIVRATQNYFQ